MIKVILALLLLTGTAHADKLKLTMQQVIDIQEGLAAIDNRDTAGKPLFKLNASVVLRIARNLAATKDLIVIYNKERFKLFQELSGGKDKLCPDPNPMPKDYTPSCPALAKFNARNFEMLNAAMEVNLWKINYAEMKPDENQFQATALMQIMPILDGVE